MTSSSTSAAGHSPLASLDLARTAARAADSKGATEILILDVAQVMGICELFVIVTAANTPMVKAVTDEIQERLAVDCDQKPRAIEGADGRRWVLIDYADIVVHVFLTEDREYYRLERLYADSVQHAWKQSAPSG
ncbi:MAG: ribosome silencing factor [Actinomycetes bacterium]